MSIKRRSQEWKGKFIALKTNWSDGSLLKGIGFDKIGRKFVNFIMFLTVHIKLGMNIVKLVKNLSIIITVNFKIFISCLY